MTASVGISLWRRSRWFIENDKANVDWFVNIQRLRRMKFPKECAPRCEERDSGGLWRKVARADRSTRGGEKWVKSTSIGHDRVRKQSRSHLGVF